MLIQLLEEMIYLLLFCVVAVCFIVSTTADRVFGVCDHPVISALIGSAIGIIIMFVNIELAVVAIIVGAVVTLISGFLLDKFF